MQYKSPRRGRLVAGLLLEMSLDFRALSVAALIQ